MSIITSGLRFLGCFILSLATYMYADTNQKYDVKNAALQKALTNLIHQYSVPGVVVTYGFDNQPLQTVTAGFDDLQTGSPMDANALFSTGSVTKSFVGAAILEQVEAGKLQVNESLAELAQQYGGELAQTVAEYPALGEVTVQELLEHNSGVPEDINTKAFETAFISHPKRIWTDQELLAIAMQNPFFFKPGSNFSSYTNTDYLLLGIVLKSVTHQNISEIFQHLWAEANLQGIYYSDTGVLPKAVREKMAIGYEGVNSSDSLLPAFQHAPKVTIPSESKSEAYMLDNAYTIFLGSAGGVIANTEALTQWYRALFQGDILSKQSIQAMTAGGVTIGEYGGIKYGFGVAVYQTPQYGHFIAHDGYSPGYSVICFYFFKEHLALTIAINSSDPSFLNSVDVNTGKALPGALAEIMPLLAKINS